jgi:hypothetical protein
MNNKVIAGVGVLLAAALIVNAMAMVKVLNQQPTAPQPADGSSAKPTESTVDVNLDPIVAELEAIRRELETQAAVSGSGEYDVAGLKTELRELREALANLQLNGGGSDTVRQRYESQWGQLPESVMDDPAVLEALKNQKTHTDIWTGLNSLMGLREQLGNAKYEELVMKLTVDHLDLAPTQIPGFTAAVDASIEDMAAANKSMQEWYAANPYTGGNDQQAMQQWQAEYQKVMMDVQTEQARAGEHLSRFLDDNNATHQNFKSQIQSFAYYLRPEKYNEIYNTMIYDNMGGGFYGGWGEEGMYQSEKMILEDEVRIVEAQTLELDAHRMALEEELKKVQEAEEAGGR